LHIAASVRNGRGRRAPRGVVDHQARSLELGRSPCDLVLHGLKVRHRFAELLPFLRVLDGVIERALRQADHLRADADASLVERFDRDLVALADVAEDVDIQSSTPLMIGSNTRHWFPIKPRLYFPHIVIISHC